MYIIYIRAIFLGLTTFNDGTNGFPKNEGFHKNCTLVKKQKCPGVVKKAQNIAFLARNE